MKDSAQPDRSGANFDDRNTVQLVREYIETEIDAAKLKSVEALSIVVSRSLGFVVLALSGLFVLGLLTSALVLWLEEVMNDIVSALLVTAGIYLTICLLFAAVSDRIMTNRIVARLCRTVFKNTDNCNGNTKR